MFDIGVPELLLVLVVTLLFLGPRHLPEVGDALGKTIIGFRRALRRGTAPDEQEKRPHDPPPRVP